jgi:hypothetical protein
MSISALTDFIMASGLIGSALYDDKNWENFSGLAPKCFVAMQNFVHGQPNLSIATDALGRFSFLRLFVKIAPELALLM